jgi:ribosomal protein L37AE/L43A
MKVIAIKCPNCKDTIFSRATHDFMLCSCGHCHIDGGFNYTKIGGKNISKPFELEVNASKKELYDDWNKGINKFGLIKEKD